MVAHEPGELPRAGRITDARGRTVAQLDPVSMRVLHQHDVIQPDELRAIAGEPGVRITGTERAWLTVAVLFATCVVAFFTFGIIVGDIRQAFYAKFSGLVFLCSMPFVAWYSIKRGRWGKVAAAMLKHLRCPHCGYSLHMLPVDALDGATVCPECGCAWHVPANADAP